MRLYKFLNKKNGLKVLGEHQLKISRIGNVNDPFEMLGYDLRDRGLRSALTARKEKLDRDWGVLCLSATWKHPLLWGHYADSHQGLCLGFDVQSADTFSKVSYKPRRFDWPLGMDGNPRAPDENEFSDLLFTKYSGWRYEAEYRAKLKLSDETYEKTSGNFYTPFDKDLRLAQVIVGSASTIERKEVVKAVGQDEVSIIKARPAFRSFKVVTQRSDPNWPLARSG